MSIAIVSICSEEYAPLADLTSKQEYALRHGYGLFMCESPNTKQLTAGYERMAFALKLMEEDQSIEWVWMVGVDSLVTNQTIKIESFLPPNERECLVIAHDGQCLNGDSVLVRNTIEGRSLLITLLAGKSSVEGHHWGDSWHITLLKGDKIISPFIRVIPQKSFNSYPGYMYPDQAGTFAEWSEGDFLIHWPGLPLERRIELAREYLPKVIR